MKNGINPAVMTSNKIVLLDSNVVAGIVALGRNGNQSEKHKSNASEWEKSINNLLSNLNKDPTQIKLKVPTPICYELMAWDKKWFDLINSSKYKSYFNYSSYNISNKFIKIAARYAYESRINTGSDDKSAKIKTMDPLLASYSIMFNYPILTENECDFPNSHFEVIGIDLLNLTGNNKKYRSILYLLQPKKEIREKYSDLF